MTWEIVLTIGLATSAALDTGSTLRLQPYRELNPIVRPFNRPHSLILFQSSVTLATWGASKNLKKQGHKGWWIPLAAGTIAHTTATIYNLKQ